MSGCRLDVWAVFSRRVFLSRVPALNHRLPGNTVCSWLRWTCSTFNHYRSSTIQYLPVRWNDTLISHMPFALKCSQQVTVTRLLIQLLSKPNICDLQKVQSAYASNDCIIWKCTWVASVVSLPSNGLHWWKVLRLKIELLETVLVSAALLELLLCS